MNNTIIKKEIIDNVWTTLDGRKIPIHQLDNQHLSNIYWYFKVLGCNPHQMIESEIWERFLKPIPLSYKPLPISGEINMLKERGLIIGTDIIFEGIVIGSISHIKE